MTNRLPSQRATKTLKIHYFFFIIKYTKFNLHRKRGLKKEYIHLSSDLSLISN
jgi:hypothetical protein